MTGTFAVKIGKAEEIHLIYNKILLMIKKL
jgi:hypothetical protein